ncbi:MAG: insulinase family protein [Paludibacteraceae bacterium]
MFRGFQSELETVYEEKNMYADALGYMALEKVLERIFKPHPYQYPVIGSSENLKNPRLTEMRKFFEKYYVAGNMGLMLSGDFDTEKALPVLEKTFGKVKKGEVRNEDFSLPTPLRGKENFKVKIPIPLVKANALIWRGVPVNHPDEIPLQIAMKIFSNGNKTGLLDKLSTDGKLMQVMGANMSMNDAGVIVILGIPNVPFQSYKSEQKYIFDAIKNVKNGDFSEEMFQSLKMEEKREHLTELEEINSRVQQMMMLYSENKTWESYLNEINKIDMLTKQDIVNVVSAYFTENYLDVKKKTGKYPSEKVQKPSFAPIQTQNKEKQSDYAQWLESIETPKTSPRFIDFEKEGKSYPLNSNGLAKLYYVSNPMNDVFTLSLNYGVGDMQIKEAGVVATYLDYLGTDSMSVNRFNEKLQQLGSQLYFYTEANTFKINITGFDKNFEKTILLAGDFLKNVKADKSKLKQVVSGYKVETKAIRSSSDNLAEAILEKVKYGERSKYLSRLTVKEVKKLTGNNIIDRFREILATECDIHYCGRLSQETVLKVIKDNINTEGIVTKTKNPIFKEGIVYNDAEVFFYNDPKATQSIIYGYVVGPKNRSLQDNNLNQLFNTYFGGGMSSLMFQEIREFRSLAYRAYSFVENPPLGMTDKHSLFNLMLSTQADKTLDALQALDSVFHSMPVVDKRIETAKQDVLNAAYNNYPSFRDVTPRVAYYKSMGYDDDPNKSRVEITSTMTSEDVKRIYTQAYEKDKVTYVIVGNKKKMDINSLAKFGKVTELKAKDFLK